MTEFHDLWRTNTVRFSGLLIAQADISAQAKKWRADDDPKHTARDYGDPKTAPKE
jgi:hypothetical protein